MLMKNRKLKVALKTTPGLRVPVSFCRLSC